MATTSTDSASAAIFTKTNFRAARRRPDHSGTQAEQVIVARGDVADPRASGYIAQGRVPTPFPLSVTRHLANPDYGAGAALRTWKCGCMISPNIGIDPLVGQPQIKALPISLTAV